MASVNCTPVMFSLMECMAKNENNPLSCIDLKRTLATCVASAVRCNEQLKFQMHCFNPYLTSSSRLLSLFRRACTQPGDCQAAQEHAVQRHQQLHFRHGTTRRQEVKRRKNSNSPRRCQNSNCKYNPFLLSTPFVTLVHGPERGERLRVTPPSGRGNTPRGRTLGRE